MDPGEFGSWDQIGDSLPIKSLNRLVYKELSRHQGPDLYRFEPMSRLVFQGFLNYQRCFIGISTLSWPDSIDRLKEDRFIFPWNSRVRVFHGQLHISSDPLTKYVSVPNGTRIFSLVPGHQPFARLLPGLCEGSSQFGPKRSISS